MSCSLLGFQIRWHLKSNIELHLCLGVSLSSDMKVDLWQEGTGGNEVRFLPVFDGEGLCCRNIPPGFAYWVKPIGKIRFQELRARADPQLALQKM